MKTDDWYGLYGSPWTNVIDGTMSHPAKYSRKLIQHIYKHTIEEGWVKPGDVVIDPFAGVALGAAHAMLNGLNWIGIELEERFVEIGRENLRHWDQIFAHSIENLGWGSVIQGDSRNLLTLLETRGLALSLSSPPYADLPVTDNQRRSRHRPDDGAMDGPTRYGLAEGNLGNMSDGDIDLAISSPPFGTAETRDRHKVQPGFIEDCIGRAYTQDKQGTTEGNLSGMDDSDGLALALSSPPYAETDLGGGAGILRRDPKIREGHGLSLEDENYGGAEGQLGNMKGDLDAALAVSSPPYAETRIAHEGGKAYMDSIRRSKDPPRYGVSDAQLGAKSKENFWVAALDIVRQVFLALRPGGHAIWVTKRYVKDKQIVEFSEQWYKLCVATGFEPVHWHRAWFIDQRRVQISLFDEIDEEKVDHKGFFRRLAEQKGSPRIDWEDVMCLRKP